VVTVQYYHPERIELTEKECSSKNVAGKLQNGHPAACSHFDYTNNHDVAALNPALPNPPLLGSPVKTSRV
jgi:hypothetical protein